MTRDALRAVLTRYPELQAGLPDHIDELVRIAARILEAESQPAPAPVPWAGLDDVERARAFDSLYPARRKNGAPA